MRVKDEEQWTAQRQEFDADELSRKFRDFLEFWVGAADTLIDESNDEMPPREALSKAFVVAEQTFGYLSVEWIGQMLLVIVQHWFSGDAVWEQFSVWERRMVEQATAMKLVELQESAKVSVEQEQQVGHADDATG